MDFSELTAPVAQDNPCGADLQWDADMMALEQTMLAAVAEDEAVVDGERVAREVETFEDVIRMAESLCARTKDLRVLTILAEAHWHMAGVSAFAEAMATLVAVVEAWPDGSSGVHPRADPEDGDLAERAAPLGKLLFRIPILASTVGWGPNGEGTVDERRETAHNLHQAFDDWQDRLGPALHSSLPAVAEAWQALQPFAALGAEDAAPQDTEAASDATASVAPVRTTDPWELIQRAEELMRETAPHSPALPVLGMLLRWRNMNIIDVMLAMRASGLTLEQLLEAIRMQSEQQA